MRLPQPELIEQEGDDHAGEMDLLVKRNLCGTE